MISLSPQRIETAKKVPHSLSTNHAPSLRDRLRYRLLSLHGLVITDKGKQCTRAVQTAVSQAQSSQWSLNFEWKMNAAEKRDDILEKQAEF